MNNFLKAGPAWVSNLLSIIFASLVFLNTIGPQLIKFFTDVNCESCIVTVNTILGVVALALSFLKALSAANTPTESNDTGKINSILILFLLSAALSSQAISQPHTNMIQPTYYHHIKIPSAESEK